MRYEKPEVAVMESAVAAIQRVEKATSDLENNILPSIPAYEADE